MESSSDIDEEAEHELENVKESCKLCYECPYCLERCDGTDALEMHMRSHRTTGLESGFVEVALFQCPACRLWFDQFATLVNHTHKHNEQHQNHEQLKTGQPRHECPACYTIFTHIRELSRHKRMHYNGISYACQFCSKRFGHYAGLEVHIKGHEKDAPLRYSCEICSRGYSTLEELQVHVRVCLQKEENMKIPCPICPKLCSYERQMVIHMKNVHYGEKSDGSGKTPKKNRPTKAA